MEEQQQTNSNQIPLAARHTNWWDMFATWVGANANNGTWFVGGVLAACGFAVAMKVLVISSALSYVFLSLVGYMGYKTGLSTMTLSRASFGERGSYLPSLVNITQFIGWTAVNTFIAAQSVGLIFTQLWGWPSFGKSGGWKGLVVGIVVMSVLHILSISAGSRSIQLIERLGIILVLVFVVWESVAVFKTVSLAEIAHWSVPAKQRMATGAAVDYVAAFNLAWVTAGADFTRFTASRMNSIISPFVGAMVGVLWFAFIGLISTISIAIISGVYNANNSDPSTIAAKLGLGIVALLVIILTSMTANAVNLLGAGSALSNIFPKISLKSALWLVVSLATIVTFIPMFVGSFLDTFESFLDYVAMVLGPTIAIICTDFYWKAKRHYQVAELGQVNGRYWYRRGVNPAAIITFIVGVVIFLTFRNQEFFVNSIGITFVDMLVSGLLYMGLSKLQRG
ncbi:MAG: cytosine permease [Limosilactobacillus gorillae]|uniref:cytosine permease n=1 Tax=Limosilactobacillus gorillae TaxID=1450649 RepID=UPI000AE1DDE0|nr:cytosine permease [Limosilactobacillus gorillae]MDO4855866.1 cytosine permease [Limosilactobacillus gorillae]